jgi:uncharacterized protein with HEPN domain
VRSRVYLDHILQAISRIEEYLEGTTQADFLKTPLIQDAVLHQIQIIGEAGKRVAVDFRDQTPAVPWRDIIGMRDKLVHDYMGVDLGIVWATAKRDLPVLKLHLRESLRDEPIEPGEPDRGSGEGADV